MLGAFVLALGDDSGGEVGDADGGLGFVDFLSAGPGGAVEVDADVFGADVDVVDFLGFGEDGDGGGGGMNAPASFGDGNTLYAVSSTFVAEGAVNVLTFDLEDDFLEATLAGIADIDEANGPATAFGVALVHAVEVGGEEGGFLASGAGADFDDGVSAVVGVGRDEGDHGLALGFGELAFDGFDFLDGHGAEVGVGVVVVFEFAGFVEAVLEGEGSAAFGEDVLKALMFADAVAIDGGLGGGFGEGEFPFEFLEAGGDAFDVGVIQHDWRGMLRGKGALSKWMFRSGSPICSSCSDCGVAELRPP